MSVIGSADPQVGHAFRGLGMVLSSKPDKPASLELTIDRYQLLVGVKPVTHDERIDKFPGAIAQALLRVDAQAAERMGLAQGQDLDRWLGRQEMALGALVAPMEGYRPPFPGLRLRHQQVQRADPWVSHMVTRDRFRFSLWLVVEA